MSRTAREQQVPRLMMVDPDARTPLIDPRNAEAAEREHRTWRSRRWAIRLQWAAILLLASVIAVQVGYLVLTLTGS